MVKNSIVKIVRKLARILKKEGVKIDKIVLYGSYAEERERRESDIDVAIISSDFGKDPTEEGMLLFRIAGSVDPRIEPVPISLKSYQQDTWLPLIYAIRERGIEVKI